MKHTFAVSIFSLFLLFAVAFVPIANALAVAIRQAPEHGAACKINGDLLADKGGLKAAQASCEKAVTQPETVPFQKAEAFNQMGRLMNRKGNFAQTRSFYDEAINLDPYLVEPTSNDDRPEGRHGCQRAHRQSFCTS